ncbi:MAG: transposon-transfer assisting family protein [Oscillospiraceae bacterium]|jgi:hypothetical protein|nr:transposon-transfer assisting family protein [Oscillospiraceae bacterium]
MEFTKDELTLISIYDSAVRKGTIVTLKDMMKYLSVDETELNDLTNSAIEKLEKITDEEYEALDLFPDFDEMEDADAE